MNLPPKRETLDAMGGPEGLMRSLGTGPSGLPAGDNKKERIEAFGENVFPQPPSKTFFELFVEALSDRTLIILCIAAVVSLVLGVTTGDAQERKTGWIEGAAILVSVLIVSLVTSGNDYSKEKQFRRLNAAGQAKDLTVIRDDKTVQVPNTQILVGDVLKLETGDILPADGICIFSNNLKCNEASMTGESDDLKKEPTGDPFLFCGCRCVDGNGQMVVTAVGAHSQWGNIKAMLQTPREETELQKKLSDVAEKIGRLGLVTAVITFSILAAQWAYTIVKSGRGFNLTEMRGLVDCVIIAVTIIVVAVPEGLPLAVTIALAYSMLKMLKENNLVRHLESCETMGGATNICSDKTGTLTENQMTVVKGFFGGEFQEELGAQAPFPDSFAALLYEGICTNSTGEITIAENGVPVFIGSKTECALLQMAKNYSVDYTAMRKATDVTKMYPFSSAKKSMSVVVRTPAGLRLHQKGASEIVLGRCQSMLTLEGQVVPLDETRRAHMLEIIESMANRALRTIGIAYADLPESYALHETHTPEVPLTLLAIVGIQDPVRKAVPDAVKRCHRAGITVRMVTGDNITTARAIARDCGILTEGGVTMEGPVFRNLSLDEMDNVIPRLQVLARSSPQDKYVLVNRLQELGEVVAVTGDGTNDAPALKKADVGFSMGITGTEVSKEASDIVLMDDNFSSIVRAVLWGRNVYDSIRKFLQFQLTVNIVAIVLAFVSSVFGGEPPLKAVQMLWVNLIMDTFAALALATEQPTPDLLYRPPYGRNDNLITNKMWRNVIGQAAYQLVVLFTMLYFPCLLRVDPHSLKHHTLIFNTFVMLQLFNEINSRRITDEMNVFKGLLTNKLFSGVLVFTLVMQIFLVEKCGVFAKTTPLTLNEWLLCIAIGFGAIPLGFVLRMWHVKEPVPPSVTRPHLTFRQIFAAKKIARVLKRKAEERARKHRLRRALSTVRLAGLIKRDWHARDRSLSRRASTSALHPIPHAHTHTQ